jgi:ubiquinone/menaquinone biosynthesis C-methylase UbiE
MNLQIRLIFTALSLAGVFTNPALAQEHSVRPGINDQYKDPNPDEWAAKWEAESREIYALREKIVAVCALKPGMAVADIGAGTGLYTRLFATAVGAEGKVYAVDIAEKFVKYIEKTCEKAGLKNVVGVVCTEDSAKLPPDSIDVAYICDVYHHFEFPYKTMASIHQALRKDGRVVIVDFRRIEEVSPEWILKHVRAGQEVVTREIESCGFRLVEEPEGLKKALKENYCIIFQKVDAPKEKPAR